MMLLSILLSLKSSHAAPILGSLGRPANAWFLAQITRSKPELGSALHDGQGPKPYTVSTLLDHLGLPLSAGKWLQPGEVCWLRVTTFNKELSELVLRQILPRLPAKVDLYKMSFYLEGWTLDPAQHTWAGQSSYTNLAQEYELTQSSQSVRLEFVTPTAFRSQGADIPLPIPGHILRGWWQKWNAFAPEPMQIHSVWPEFANACVMVSELGGINSDRWTFAEGTRGAATGFTGVAGFHLLPKRQCGDFAAFWDGADQVLQNLARFAFYCGTGHHTTIGMGQTRPLPARSQKKVTPR